MVKILKKYPNLMENIYLVSVFYTMTVVLLLLKTYDVSVPYYVYYVSALFIDIAAIIVSYIIAAIVHTANILKKEMC
jgi:hypothetical protein